MSYGRALKMFGQPAGPGEDTWRQKSEPKAESSVEDSIAQVSIAEGGSPASMLEPRTEEEHRRQNGWHPPTAPLLSSDKQWALFDSNKYLAYTSILARQYHKLVVEKECKEGEQFDESSRINTIVPDDAKDSEGWPPVDRLDFEGFTSWISRCKEAVPSFPKTTLKPWIAERDARLKSTIEKLKQWKPPPGFDDGSSKHPDPRKYYSGPSIAEIDLETLGHTKIEKTTPKR